MQAGFHNKAKASPIVCDKPINLKSGVFRESGSAKALKIEIRRLLLGLQSSSVQFRGSPASGNCMIQGTNSSDEKPRVEVKQ